MPNGCLPEVQGEVFDGRTLLSQVHGPGEEKARGRVMSSSILKSFLKKKNKYGAIKTKGGFHSKLEEAVYGQLYLRECQGGMRIVCKQKNIYLSEARVLYIADFECETTDTHEIFYVEAKGFEGPRWPTIKKLWKVYGPGKLEIWKGTHIRPVLVETIIPRGVK